jgi:hypothetical protein
MPLIAVCGTRTQTLFKLLYEQNVVKVLFDFNADVITTELKKYIDEKENPPEKTGFNQYIINFYTNHNTFFIDISGPLEKEKIKALGMMFKHSLGASVRTLKGVVYIFNNTDDTTMNFPIVWSLFSIWESIGIDLKKVAFLTTSDKILKNVNTCFKDAGVQAYANLFEIIKVFYPEFQNKPELEIFEFASTLLQGQQAG